MTPTLVYAFDPLCGWCFGFRPACARLRRALEGRVRWDVRMGGLLVGSREQPIGAMRAYLEQGMAMVEARTEARFGEGFRRVLEEGTWISRSEPACRAILAVRDQHGGDGGDGGEAALAFGEELCRAFYEDGELPDDAATIAAVCRRTGIAPEPIVTSWDTVTARERTASHFAHTRAEGIDGYPTLLLRTGDGERVLFRGCVDASQAIAAVEAALTT